MGAYTHPGGQENRKRPAIEGMPYNPHFIELATRYSKDELHPELLEGIDMVMVMHVPTWIVRNAGVLKDFADKGGRVVWRSIGQSVPHVERQLAPYTDWLEIVRYAYEEATITDNAGCDALIPFYKDPDEYKGWYGNDPVVINFTQSLLSRGEHCGWAAIRRATAPFNTKIYGPGNDDLPEGLNGGLVSYDEQKNILRRSRVYFYTGTYPASYTLSFIEAMMTGIPMVCVGDQLGNGPMFPEQKVYAIPQIIENGISGIWSNSMEELQDQITALLEEPDYAAGISEAGRERAIALFGKESVRESWTEFFNREVNRGNNK